VGGEGETEDLVMEYLEGFGLYGYDVPADGKRFLVNDAGEAGVPRVSLVVN